MLNLPNLPNLPKLPEKEELVFKEKSFLLTVFEQLQNSAHLKLLLWILLASVVLAWPGKFFLQRYLANYLINRQPPLRVNLNPHNPQDIRIIEPKVIPVVPGIFSAYAQLVNPNPELSASFLKYRFVFQDAQDQIVKQETGESFLLAGESKFLLLPVLNVAEIPVDVEVILYDINWTLRKPVFEVRMEVLQKNTGVTAEGQFFVEGLLRNHQGFGIRTLPLAILVFDSQNQNLLAVNATTISDLEPLESRYFRVIWPRIYENIGEVQILPLVNELDPGLILEKSKATPEIIPAL